LGATSGVIVLDRGAPSKFDELRAAKCTAVECTRGDDEDVVRIDIAASEPERVDKVESQ
jgi:hypothetical protein